MKHKFPCLLVQKDPAILSAVIPGIWLLDHCVPSWRIDQPLEGFQRVVDENRAQKIAVNVLDQKRTFPNAIVLASDFRTPKISEGMVELDDTARFLILDGQHRLFSQKFSDYNAPYMCVVHLGLTEKEMAELFLEINDNQKRVPSSLRWDLFRLTRPDDEQAEVRTSDLVFDLASDKKSALYQRIDMTGEQPGISLKQGSVAPAIKSVVGVAKAPLIGFGYDVQLRVLMDYVSAMRECEPQAWDNATSPLYGARVFRAALRLLGDIVEVEEKPASELDASVFLSYLSKVDLDDLSSDRIKATQGSAGIKAIYDTLRNAVI